MSTPGQFVGSGIQVYVPLLELSGNLQVSFSRNPNTIRNKLNGYTKQVLANGLRGNYLSFNPEENARIGPRDLRWQQNTPRPVGNDGGVAFTTRAFECQRYQKAMTLDMDSVDVANFALQERTTAALAQIIATNRVRQVCSKITTSGSFAASNVQTATALAGGFLHLGTVADPRILTAVQESKAIIQAATYGRFTDGEIGLLCNPNTARKFARTREIREYVSNQVNSFDWIKGKAKEYNGGYMLPPFLYDTQVIVEETMFTDQAVDGGATAGAPFTDVAKYAFPDNTMLVFVRAGDLDQDEGAAGQDFSTFTQFVYKGADMSLEAMTDQWNRTQYFGMTDWFDTQVTSPYTGVLVTNLFS